jgi:AcrR family transcriptional regulator
MQAAEGLFASRRFHEITLEAVASAAGVGKGTIYRYFLDKDDLFFQTATSGFEELCELLRRKVPEHAGFQEQLLASCVHISAFFDRRRKLRMMQTEDGRHAHGHGKLHDKWQAKRKLLVAAMAEIIRKGVAERRIRADVAPEALAQFLLGMLRTRARDLAEAPAEARRHELVVDLFCRGAGMNGKQSQ